MISRDIHVIPHKDGWATKKEGTARMGIDVVVDFILDLTGDTCAPSPARDVAARNLRHDACRPCGCASSAIGTRQ